MCTGVSGPEGGQCSRCGMRLVPASPDVSWVCLTHLDEGAIDIESGACRTCGEAFVPTATREVYTCARHPGISLDEAGECPLCGAHLAAGRVAVTWSCAQHPKHRAIGARAGEPPRCSDCDASLQEMRSPLPHGDHTPKHGGVFFMAANRWHHLEGTLPVAGEFRLFLYDNFTRPLDAADVEARAIITEWLESGESRAVGDPVPLTRASENESNVLVARSPRLEPPLDLQVEIRLDAGRETEKFDFRFETITVEPTADDAEPAIPLERVEIPSSPEEIVAAVKRRAELVRRALRERRLAELFRPALEAKDLALALEDYRDDLAAPDRIALERALQDVVRGAWRLDLYGDAGNLEGATAAAVEFARGVGEIARIFAAADEP